MTLNLVCFLCSSEETRSLVSNTKKGPSSFISKVPDWIEVEELDWKERVEINAYKLVSLVPVAVTFLLYTLLFSYYVFFYLKPTLEMDYSSISFDAVWEKDTDKAKDLRQRAMFHGAIFMFTSVFLLISIIRTICTSPGNIPDHKEWDMSTDQSATDDDHTPGAKDEAGARATAAANQEQGATEQGERFTNTIIDKNTKDPKEIVHEDFKYLATTAGPLIESRERT